MARQRMYLFERAYVNYATRLRGFNGRTWTICSSIWSWFWRGTGANAIEIILRIAIVATAVGVGVLYFRYESARGNSFSASSIAAILGIVVFTGLVLWGWKAPVQVVARALSGASAAGLILTLTLLAIAIAVGAFAPYLLALFALTLLSFVVFLPMRGAHGLWLLYRRVTYRCPWDDCSYSGLPIHICPCGRQYDDLRPSFYGIFRHICRTDNREDKLPTMDFLGRNKLQRLCGGCKRPLILSSIGELAERPIAVVGGTNAGKTVFLRQALRQLHDRLSAMPGSTVRIDSEPQKQELERDLRLMDRGQVPAKTSGDAMQAVGLAVRIPKRLHCLLYLFDAPGEHFATVEQFGRKQVLQHLAGIILLVDPFSLPALADDPRFRGADLRPSETPFQRIVEVLIAGVNLMLVRQPSRPCTVPLAVVLGKADALPAAEFPFLADVRPGKEHIWSEALNTQTRQALVKLGAERSVRALEQKFSSVRYFTCTALGRMPDLRSTSPFQPVGVIEPFLWMLEIDRAVASRGRG